MDEISKLSEACERMSEKIFRSEDEKENFHKTSAAFLSGACGRLVYAILADAETVSV